MSTAVDKVVDAAASTLTPGAPGAKDSYDLIVQQAFANDPDLLKKLNDPRVKKILSAAMGDAFIKGNEKLVSQALPGIIEKTNLSQIDLNKADADALIAAEAEKAKRSYDGWLAQQNAQADIDKKRSAANLEVNAAGSLSYQRSAGGFAALAGFITAIVDCFQKGSIEPLKDYVRDVSSPKSYSLQTTDASVVRDISNPYTLQRPAMPGASTPEQIGRAQSSANPMAALTGGDQGTQTGSDGKTTPETAPVNIQFGRREIETEKVLAKLTAAPGGGGVSVPGLDLTNMVKTAASADGNASVLTVAEQDKLRQMIETAEKMGLKKPEAEAKQIAQQTMELILK